jgi:hypothetical protein
MAPGTSETVWSVAMLVAAGLIAARVTLATRGNAAYATAIIWALVGVVVANTIERAENLPVAVAAGSMAVVVAATLTRVRIEARHVALARG